MKLSELKSDDLVILEVVTKEKTLRFEVSVCKVLNNILYLNVVRADERYLSLGKTGMFPDATYNIIFVNESTRIEWKRINISMYSIKCMPYYGVEIKSFNDIGNNADRRIDSRLDVNNMTGTLINNGKVYNITILNVSTKSIGFSYSDDLDLVNNVFDIKIVHLIHGRVFDLTLHCICKQSRLNGNMYIYGCEVRDKGNKYASFVNLYRIMSLAELKGINLDDEEYTDDKKSSYKSRKRNTLQKYRSSMYEK